MSVPRTAHSVPAHAVGQLRAVRVSFPWLTGSQPQDSAFARAVSTPTAPAVRSRHLGQFPVAHRPSVPRQRLAGPALAGRPASRPCPERHVRSRAAFLRPSESLRVRGPPHAHLTSERVTGLRLPYLPAGSATGPNVLPRAAGPARTPIPTQARASAAGATALAKKRRDLRVAARSREQRHDRRQGSGERLKRRRRLVPHRAIALRSRRRTYRGRATPMWRAEGGPGRRPGAVTAVTKPAAT